MNFGREQRSECGEEEKEGRSHVFGRPSLTPGAHDTYNEKAHNT